MESRKQLLLNVLMVSVSWISLAFLGMQKIRRYMPASILIGVFEAINAIYAKKQKWWIFYNRSNSYLAGEFAFNIGPFFAVSLWILSCCYGNFKKFIFYNGVVHAFFSTFVIKYLDNLKVSRLCRINHFQFFLYFFYKAFLLYGLQYLIEKRK